MNELLNSQAIGQWVFCPLASNYHIASLILAGCWNASQKLGPLVVLKLIRSQGERRGREIDSWEKENDWTGATAGV